MGVARRWVGSLRDMPRRQPDRTPAKGRGPRRSPPPERARAGPRRWGGVARRGAATLGESGAAAAWRDVAPEARPRPPEERQQEQWIDEGELRDEATDAVGRGEAPVRDRRRDPGRRSANGEVGGDRGAPDQRRRSQRRRQGDAAPSDAVRSAPRGTHGRRDRRERRGNAGDAEARGAEGAGAEAGGGSRGLHDALRRAVGPKQAARAAARVREASEAFRRERFEDVRRNLRPLAEQAPGAAAVRELHGLALYRLGRWSQARRELEAFRTLTGSTEQHPVLADCYRALGRHREVEELWDELRAASPSAALVAEGRIVAAGSLADRGRLGEAIRLLQAGVRRTKRARPHHLRMAYALADLYERAGDVPQARELFSRVAASEPDFVDVQERLYALR